MAKKLFVGGLSWNTTNESLRSAFAKYGEVTDAQVITDRDTGRSRGFGFVTLADAEAGEAAISGMNGKDLDGRAVKVSEAMDKAPRSGGGDRDRGPRRGGGRF
jgi:RNA recognition motif-containing protein